jgi:HYDIN/CFA65/VesB-like, Ig-like domain/Abnormal spindle-like microcephaly-assoc'd, ASPM-SPD-2-Hydin
MRSFPKIVIAALLCCLAPASALAQLQLHCSPVYHSFGKVEVGSSRTYTFQLTNKGSATIKILAQPKAVGAFSPSHLPWKILAGASVQFTVTFAPTAVGHTPGFTRILSNAENSPLVVEMQGTGFDTTSPELGISPATLRFGSVTVGASASLQATLTASNAAVTISSDQSTSSEFAITGMKLPVTIAAGSSLPVTIKFTPNASGTASAKAGFISNAVNTPAVAQLTGTGIAAASHQVTLSWDSGDGSAVGYNVYRATVKAGPFTMINPALDSLTSYTDSTVVGGTTYFYATTEVNAQGQESAYSNLAKAVIPSP